MQSRFKSTPMKQEAAMYEAITKAAIYKVIVATNFMHARRTCYVALHQYSIDCFSVICSCAVPFLFIH